MAQAGVVFQIIKLCQNQLKECRYRADRNKVTTEWSKRWRQVHIILGVTNTVSYFVQNVIKLPPVTTAQVLTCQIPGNSQTAHFKQQKMLYK